ncbi:hypothetical protein F53441_9633 [Fusarium austroafricanum]|uniref:Uncharacterized protein n=1 Tax=Fusarium austroafricanum TaxID=2364996 RepID=A0A8H4NT24_9HYPO|nr:hypothetical protein F53441_9633 [Fusarium austroafricanum]
MSLIVTLKLKREHLPPNPRLSSSPVPASLPFSPPTKQQFVTSSPRTSRFADKCPVCKATIVNRNGGLHRHIKRHAKLAKIEAMNIEIEPMRGHTVEFDIARARDIWLSVPAKLRSTGGVFLDGPLAGKGVIEGMPEVFLPNGRVKTKWMWIKKDLETRIGRGPLKTLKNTNATA